MAVTRIQIADRETWLNLRRQDVTASDIGALFQRVVDINEPEKTESMHDYKSLMQLWAEKTGKLAPTSDTEMMQRGRWLEPSVLMAFKDAHPDWTIRQPNMYLRDPELRLGATPDAIAMKPGSPNDIIVQCKVINSVSFKEKWEDGPPDFYVLQTLTEAMLWGAESAILAVLSISTFGADYYEFDVPRNAGVEAMIREESVNFWDMVKSGIAPKADHSRDIDVITQLYAANESAPPVDFTKDNRMPSLCAEYLKLGEAEKEAKEAREALKSEILEKLKGSQRGSLPGWSITNKTINRKSYTVEAGSYQRLTVKPA